MDVCIIIEKAAASATNRLDLWSKVAKALEIGVFAEVGVFKGDFAEYILHQCNTISKYYMIDPWQHLDDWNKPLNKSDDEFNEVKRDAIGKTEFAAAKRVILQGKTINVSGSLPDQGLDLAYIDGDHTLRGITADLIRIWPKIRTRGILAGDDFCDSVWEHSTRFEPTLVFPFALYFAEAVGAIIYGLPFNQFAIIVDHCSDGFEFRNLTNSYKTTSLRAALRKRNHLLLKKALLERVARAALPKDARTRLKQLCGY